MKFALMAHVPQSSPDWGKEKAVLHQCQRAKKLELDGIDWLDTCGVNPKDVRRIADDCGFPAVCFTPMTVDINFPTAGERHAGLEGVKKSAETAAILGTDKIMLPMSGKQQFTSQESRRHAIAGLVEAVKIAASFRLTLTVEHYGNQRAPFRISEDVNEAVRAAPGLRVTYDSGNVWVGGEDALDGFLRSKEHIVHVHFKDWELTIDGINAVTAADKKKYVMAPIGRGLVDHTGILRALQQANYSGYVNLEYFGAKYDSDAAIAESRKYLMETLKQLPG